VNASRVFDLLVFRSWWTYRSGNPDWFEIPYHFFNLFEGVVWVTLSILVLGRFLKRPKSAIEVVYALAFFVFGLTDFREAYSLESWLIWVKAINLLVLIRLRSIVIKRYYPTSKLY
jgi:hypothetical protein